MGKIILSAILVILPIYYESRWKVDYDNKCTDWTFTCLSMRFVLMHIVYFRHMIQICSGIRSGRVVIGELYAQRLHKLIYPHLLTGCCMKISRQPSDQIYLRHRIIGWKTTMSLHSLKIIHHVLLFCFSVLRLLEWTRFYNNQQNHAVSLAIMLHCISLTSGALLM